MRRRPDGVHRRGEEEHDTGARVLLLIAGGEARLAARDGGAREEVRCGQRAAAWSEGVGEAGGLGWSGSKKGARAGEALVGSGDGQWRGGGRGLGGGGNRGSWSGNLVGNGSGRDPE